MLAQIGLLDPAGLPVAGAVQADKARSMAAGGGDPALPSNSLVPGAAAR